jgi:hypothetical protein
MDSASQVWLGVMLHVRIKLDLKCPKHPRFNPENGPGAVKAGCWQCEALCSIQAQATRVTELAREYKGAAK